MIADMDLSRIVVDDLTTTIPTKTWPYARGCHLFHLDNTVADLDTVAVCLGLAPAWRHNAECFPHYDLTTRMRQLAVDLGIRELHRRDADFRAYLNRRGIARGELAEAKERQCTPSNAPSNAAADSARGGGVS